MRHYIRNVIKEFSDYSAVRQLQLIEVIGRFYIDNLDELDNLDDLSKVSDNLNNAVIRANELFYIKCSQVITINNLPIIIDAHQPPANG